jgi:hypothetical protein
MRENCDTMALQSQVATAIAEQIRINVNPQEQAALVIMCCKSCTRIGGVRQEERSAKVNRRFEETFRHRLFACLGDSR